MAKYSWTLEAIGMITPYRPQAALYRRVFRAHGWFRVQSVHIDSAQGHENSCAILDLVLAFARIGEWGFVKEGLRMDIGTCEVP